MGRPLNQVCARGVTLQTDMCPQRHKTVPFTHFFNSVASTTFVGINDLNGPKTWPRITNPVPITYGKAPESSLCMGSHVSDRYVSSQTHNGVFPPFFSLCCLDDFCGNKRPKRTKDLAPHYQSGPNNPWKGP